MTVLTRRAAQVLERCETVLHAGPRDDAGFAVEHRFGIRCVMDLIADDARKSEPAFYGQLLDLELRICAREPYWRTARFWQLTARRGG